MYVFLKFEYRQTYHSIRRNCVLQNGIYMHALELELHVSHCEGSLRRDEAEMSRDEAEMEYLKIAQDFDYFPITVSNVLK